jgi:DNA-binding transcriptional ArsR family regulator
MREDTSTEQLRRLLETQFCDAENTDEHEYRLKKVSEDYLSQFDFGKKALLFSALAEESRLKILSLLAFREMCVCEMTAALGMTQPNLTYHIKKLESADLVKHNKRGKWVYYSLADDKGLRQIDLLTVNQSR